MAYLRRVQVTHTGIAIMLGVHKTEVQYISTSNKKTCNMIMERFRFHNGTTNGSFA